MCTSYESLLGSCAQTCRRSLHALDHERTASIRSELGWLADQVGAVRDIDVFGIRLTTTTRTLPDPDGQGARQLLDRLEHQADVARVALLSALRDQRYLCLLDTLVEISREPPFIDHSDVVGQPAARVAASFVHRPWVRLAKAVASLGPNPLDSDLHRVRILAKRCRYAAEAVAPVLGSPAATFVEVVGELQTVLGDHQDTVVAESWLRGAAAEMPASSVAAGELIAIERARRRELRDRWPTAWHRAEKAAKVRTWL